MIDRVKDPIAWMNNRKVVRGVDAGEQFQLRPWQVDYVGKLLNTRRDDGLRQYRRSSLWIPRKNGKTMLAAMIAAYYFCEELPRMGQILLTATTGKQAEQLFDNVIEILREKNPDYFLTKKEANKEYNAKRYSYSPHHRKLLDNVTKCKMQVLAADGNSAHGYDPTLVICDELHGWKNEGFFDALQTSFGAQKEPLFICITTAGTYEPESIEFREWKLATQIRDGVIDQDYYLPVIYEADPEDDWTDPEVWAHCNPALGDFRNLTDFQQLCDRAKAEPSFTNEFKRLYLNLHTATRTRWISGEQWEAAADDNLAFTGQVHGGLDLSSKVDVTAFSLVGDMAGGKVGCKSWMWIPEETALEHEKTDRVPYRAWAEDENRYVEFTPGCRIDHDYVLGRIREICYAHNCRAIDLDKWNAEHIAQELEREGFTIKEVPQTARHMTAAVSEINALLADNKLRHSNNKCLNWMAANVELDSPDRNGYVKPIKPKGGSQRVDGITAFVLAVNGLIKTRDHFVPYQKGSMF
jgi:phage terminase large subunit-like protein